MHVWSQVWTFSRLCSFCLLESSTGRSKWNFTLNMAGVSHIISLSLPTSYLLPYCPSPSAKTESLFSLFIYCHPISGADILWFAMPEHHALPFQGPAHMSFPPWSLRWNPNPHGTWVSPTALITFTLMLRMFVHVSSLKLYNEFKEWTMSNHLGISRRD